MNNKEAIAALGLPANTRIDENVNPLRLALNYEFDSRIISHEDYRMRAIKQCVKKEVSFTSECNTSREIAKMFLVVKCPKCNNDCSTGMSSGNFVTTTLQYECKCGTKVSLTVDQSFFDVTFPEKKE